MSTYAQIEEPPLMLFSSGDAAEMAELDKVLLEVPDVEVFVVAEANLLRHRVPMPFLQHPNGSRIVGVAAIRRFLHEQREAVGR